MDLPSFDSGLLLDCGSFYGTGDGRSGSLWDLDLGKTGVPSKNSWSSLAGVSALSLVGLDKSGVLGGQAGWMTGGVGSCGPRGYNE